MPNGITWKQKAGIGAVGGLSLAMLKLIDAKFFLANVTTTDAVAAYLTYFCYMVLGMVVAVFLTDHDLPDEKIRRSSFILGLLAPSVLIAIVHQPVEGKKFYDEGINNVPKLSSWLLPSAHAQDPTAPGIATESAKYSVLQRSAVETDFPEAVWKAVGRQGSQGQYTYVVGSTTSKKKAMAAADGINGLFNWHKTSSKAQVVNPEGTENYYVMVGKLDSPDKVWRFKSLAQDAATDALKSKPSDFNDSATLLLRGKVVQADSLFR